MEEPPFMEPDERSEDEIIQDALGDNSSADELRVLRLALQDRLVGLRRERDRERAREARLKLDGRITEIEGQLAILRQEEAVSQFVEDSVRVTLHKPPEEDLEEP